MIREILRVSHNRNRTMRGSVRAGRSYHFLSFGFINSNGKKPSRVPGNLSEEVKNAGYVQSVRDANSMLNAADVRL